MYAFTNESSKMTTQTRNASIDDIASTQFDVMIIGAGINGVSTFRELALNGVSVLLIERQDFCSGASAAPSRLIHGGIKYLENGEFRLVAESTLERNRLLHNAAHLVKPLPCTIPFYSWFGGLFSSAFKFLRLPAGRFKKRGAVVVTVGLLIYDWMGRKQRVMPTHKVHGAAKSHQLFTGLDRSVIATATYYDALITQPERLCLELVTDTLKDVAKTNHPCAVLSYTSVTGLDDGSVTLRDETSGREFAVDAGLVVNAAGPWIDKVNHVLGIDSHYIGGSKGSHLILNHPEMLACLNGHMLYFETGDNRLCLAYPIGDKVLVGTTDIRVDDPDTARCEEDEVDYLFTVMAELLPGVQITREHIVYRYSGVRPLPFSDGIGIGKVSRDHSIEVDEPVEGRQFAVASLVGGKWTTFRAFGEVASDLVFKRLGRVRTRDTQGLAIGGGRDYPAGDNQHAFIQTQMAKYALPEALLIRVLERYGCNPGVIEALSASEQAQQPLAALPDYRLGEIHYICKHEQITHLDDLIFRRTTLALEGRATMATVSELAHIAAPILGWDAQQTTAEIERCQVRLPDSIPA